MQLFCIISPTAKLTIANWSVTRRVPVKRNGNSNHHNEHCHAFTRKVPCITSIIGQTSKDTVDLCLTSPPQATHGILCRTRGTSNRLSKSFRRARFVQAVFASTAGWSLTSIPRRLLKCCPPFQRTQILTGNRDALQQSGWKLEIKKNKTQHMYI